MTDEQKRYLKTYWYEEAKSVLKWQEEGSERIEMMIEGALKALEEWKRNVAEEEKNRKPEEKKELRLVTIQELAWDGNTGLFYHYTWDEDVLGPFTSIAVCYESYVQHCRDLEEELKHG